MNYAGIRVYGQPRIAVFDAGQWELQKGQACVVESKSGLEFGEVVIPELSKNIAEKQKSPGKVVRPFEKQDYRSFRRKLVLERKAFLACIDQNETLNVPMKLVRVSYSFDFKKATFFYTAAGRVDFRQLVKNLAKTLRVRVEMRQIGVRDEAKMLEGCGTCGRTLCCSTYLTEFKPVSMKMAKEQNLVLNPSKVSGVCGRLKCCLAYEYHEGEETSGCIFEYDDVN